MLRERDPLLRELRPVEPRDDLTAPLGRFALLFDADDLRAPDDRLEPLLDDFAREEEDFFAPPLERALLDRERDAEDLRGDDLRAVDLRELLRVEEDPEPPLTTDSTSAVHLPDSTRCAASATASAISEPSLVALAATLVAAC